MITTIFFDVRTHMEHGKPCFYRCCGFFKKVIKTVLHVRMAEEVAYGWKFLSQKFAPPVAVQVLKVSESLFEGVPQSLLQTYIIMKLAIRGDEPTVTQYLSVASSVLGIGVAFATLGREPKPQWRLAFFLFVVVQALLRIVTLTLFFAILYQQETAAGAFQLKAMYLITSFAVCAVAVLLNVRAPAFETSAITPSQNSSSGSWFQRQSARQDQAQVRHARLLKAVCGALIVQLVSAARYGTIIVTATWGWAGQQPSSAHAAGCLPHKHCYCPGHAAACSIAWPS